MRVLITGAAGYIGSKLTNYFISKKIHVTAIDNFLHNQQPFVEEIFQSPYCSFHQRDAGNIPKHLLQRADVIYPLAAWVGAPLCDTDPIEAMRVNTTEVARLIKSISPNQRVIFPNTNSGYGNAGKEICTEETPLNSISIYGSSKELAEEVVLEHPNSTVFRLATVFGSSFRPRLDLIVNNFVYLAKTTGKIEVFEGQFKRNFVHLLDVLNMFVDCIEDSRMCQQVYNLGNDKLNMTKIDLAKQMQQHFSVEISEGSQKDPDQRDYVVSNQKLLNLGHKILTDLNYGIIELDFMLNNIDLNNSELLKTMRNI
tara:strand:+ start:1984 stop:2919 length:936 start_codon:yes stop_codon:yes gene_type:complete